MKKQYFLVPFFLMLALVLISPVFAVENVTSTSGQASTTQTGVHANETKGEREARFASTTERRVEVKNQRKATSTLRQVERGQIKIQRKASSTEVQVEREQVKIQRKASSTERKVEMQGNLARRKVDHASLVLMATIRRLEMIATRLDSRILKIETSRGTTTQAKIFVAEARGHLARASSSIAVLTSLDLSGKKAQENFERIRTLAAEIKGYLRDAHRSLKNAVQALKGPNRGRDDNVKVSTSTATSTQ